MPFVLMECRWGERERENTFHTIRSIILCTFHFRFFDSVDFSKILDVASSNFNHSGFMPRDIRPRKCFDSLFLSDENV